MKIFIPTYYRENNQKCFKSLPKTLRDRAYLLTRYDRADLLRMYNPTANIIDLGITDGIADVRQKLVQIANNEKILVVDDNTTFLERNNEDKLVKMQNHEKMIADVEKYLDEYAWVGISDRAGNNRVEGEFAEVCRSYSCYGINTKKFNELGVTFDGMYQKDNNIKQYEDFYALLSLLSKGEKNIVLYNYAFSHPHGKEGGNSNYRSSTSHEMSLRCLEKEFKGYITFKVKKNPSWTASKGVNHRFEAIIQWKKLYNDARQNNSN